MQTGLNQKRKRNVKAKYTTEQEDKYIRVSSLRNKPLKGPQLAVLLNGTPRTPVSASTVNRRLQDAAKIEKTYLRLASERKRLRFKPIQLVGGASANME